MGGQQKRHYRPLLNSRQKLARYICAIAYGTMGLGLLRKVIESMDRVHCEGRASSSNAGVGSVEDLAALREVH